MKNLIILSLCLFSFSAFAGLETFFTSLEGGWKKISADTYRETPEGEIFHSVATRFEASVSRTGNRWNFSEDMCWKPEEGEETCSKGSVAYEVDGESLFIIAGDEKLPVDVLESSDDYLVIMAATADYSFTAVLTLEGNTLTQDSVMELPDGTKEYQLLNLESAPGRE